MPMQPDARSALVEQLEEEGKLWRQNPQRLREVPAEGSTRAKVPRERWPRQLFVDPSLGAEALDYFLETGKQKDALHWIRTDAFPRTTVWEGRAGREAWEKGQEGRGRT